MTFSFLAPAQLEIEEAVDFYEDIQPGLGAEFEDEVRSTAQRILDNPLVWPKLPHSSVRRCRLRRFPYGLVYQVRHSHVLIVAVMHLRRHPEYWRARLDR